MYTGNPRHCGCEERREDQFSKSRRRFASRATKGSTRNAARTAMVRAIQCLSSRGRLGSQRLSAVRDEIFSAPSLLLSPKKPPETKNREPALSAFASPAKAGGA